MKDFSTNYCDLRNLYCGSADGCRPVIKDFKSKQESITPSFGAGTDFSKCIVPTQEVLSSSASAYKCPGSGSLIHAWTEVTVVVDASCDDVMVEMEARARAQGGWKDPQRWRVLRDC